MPRSILLRLAVCALLLPLAGCEWLTGDDRDPAPRFASVATGPEQSCALTTEGEAYCWGADVDKPRRLAGGMRFRSLHAGTGGTCGLDLNDALHCWARPDSLPRARFPETRFASVSPHLYFHVCAVTVARTVGCWGSTQSGVVRLGLAPAPGATEFAQASAGAYQTGLGGSRGFEYRGHVCGVKAAGAAFCWGDNAAGQLGIAGDARQTSEPAPVAGGVSFKEVHAGLISTCGLDLNRALYCWGRDYGRVPQRVGAGLQFATLDVGARHGCAVTAAGQAYCWGRNPSGELGTGTLTSSTEPQAVQGGVRFRSVSAAGYGEHEMFPAIAAHSCGIGTDERVYCWGNNDRGQLGTGSRASSPVPVRVARPERDA